MNSAVLKLDESAKNADASNKKLPERSARPDQKKKTSANGSKVRKGSARRKESADRHQGGKRPGDPSAKSGKSGLTQDAMRNMVREAILGAWDEESFQIKCEPIL